MPNCAPLILASASPRRAELLTFAGVNFEICPANIDETRLNGESPTAYVMRLAQEKAEAKKHLNRFVLAADTTVFIGEAIFEKPVDAQEAKNHLMALKGRTHTVATAFCLLNGMGGIISHEKVISQVTFRDLSEREMAAYVATKEGLDKAGAYGLQGQGGFLIDSVLGCYTSVIGLPLPQVLTALKSQNLA
ncbi:MAG: Maf family protein [Candidatus Adiutrix sp.]